MIRPANETDAQAIADIWNQMIRDTLATFTSVEKSAQEIGALIRQREGCFLVTTSESGLTGIATCGTFRAGPGYAATVEHTVIVAPHAQGRGLGRDLMACLEDAAKGAGAHVMVAAISGANPAAVSFHEALGFTQTGRMPEVGRKSGQWLDLVLMQKILREND